MIWPFKKKNSPSDKLPLDGPWAVRHGDHDDSLMIVRSNTGYRQIGSVPGYDHQVGIAVPIRGDGPGGVPTPEEETELALIERRICSSLEQEAESLLVAVVTTHGMREFIFYTRAPRQVEGRIEQLRERISGHEIQLIVQSDIDWTIYAQVS